MINVLSTENGYLATLPRGEWLVDGEHIEIKDYNGKEINFTSEEICRVNKIQQTIHCVNPEGSKISLFEYNQQLKKLCKNTDEDGDFSDFEEEYAYKKFATEWVNVYRYITTYDEPEKLNFIDVKVETGNKHINPILCSKNVDNGLYIYSRIGGVGSIIRDTFASLGMSFEGDIRYEETSNKKVWGNSNHSGFEYVVAFGKYIFTKQQMRDNDLRDIKGNLEQVTAYYNQDKIKIERIIKSLYNAHFRSDNVNFDFEKLLSNLKSLESEAKEIDSKQKTYYKHRTLCGDISKLIEEVQTEIAG